MDDCECALCRHKKPFDVPAELLKRFSEGKCVIFAGAGISTENPTQCRSTFYDTIASQLSLDKSSQLDFPSLMSEYCARADGRIKLIQEIKKRIEYFRSFRGFYVPMTRFHRALRPLYMIEDVITTNWDDFFETESGFEPFVYDQDLAFLESSKRRVIKIHGSVSNAGSIIATLDDYKKALRSLEKGSLGAYLKTLLSTKTIIYVGYSLRDKNYLSLVKSLNKLLGNLSRTSYFVSPQIDLNHLNSTGLKLIPIQTDGSFFLEEMRNHLNNQNENSHSIVPEENFDHCEQFLFHVNEIHDSTADLFLSTKKKLLILALSYQDGLQDALMRIKDRRSTGEYYNPQRLGSLIHGYEHKIEAYISESNFFDATYCRGYQNGLLMLASGKDEIPPLVDVCFDESIDTVAKAARLANKRIPVAAREQIDRISERLPLGHLPEHMPYV
jgi:NAD-dependent SIR2 family protein deacetylase